MCVSLEFDHWHCCKTWKLIWHGCAEACVVDQKVPASLLFTFRFGWFPHGRGLSCELLCLAVLCKQACSNPDLIYLARRNFYWGNCPSNGGLWRCPSCGLHMQFSIEVVHPETPLLRQRVNGRRDHAGDVHSQLRGCNRLHSLERQHGCQLASQWRRSDLLDPLLYFAAASVSLPTASP